MNMQKRAVIAKAVLLLCAMGACFSYVNAQFLLDDVKKKEMKPEPALPSFIARTVKAELIRGVDGAVRITFSVEPGEKSDFLVGRTTRIPSSADVALGAATVKIIKAGEEPVAIDSNLPAGQYYYVVLSRDKILARDITLHPDVNYTSLPIIIAREVPTAPVTRVAEQATLIFARTVNETQVLLTWKGVQQHNIVYTIYRAAAPINSAEQLKSAHRVGQVQAGTESFIDRTITRQGSYYYAVTISDTAGREDLKFIPDQNFTVEPVSVIIRRDSIVKNLEAELDDGSLRLSWMKPAVKIQSFAVYRHSAPITDAHVLAVAARVAVIDSSEVEFIDKKPVQGSHYFAVLPVHSDGSMDTLLVPDQNYTTKPLVVGAPIMLSGIRAVRQNGAVKISWEYSGSSGNRFYKLFRTAKAPVSAQDLNNAFLVDVVNITSNEFTDRDIPPGEHFYALVPEQYDIEPGFAIVPGINVTTEKITAVPAPHVTPQPRAEVIVPKAPPVKEKAAPEQKFVPTPNVNRIIAATFYQGRYQTCIRDLKGFLKTAHDSAEIAKAQLFIGRSYIELKQFRRSLNYLMRSDVITYYPKDAVFWRDYALSRIR